MRDPNRIDAFCKELAKIWKKNAPDWRFMQLIDNLQSWTGGDMFYIEEDYFLEVLKKFFNPSDESKDDSK